jgi:hypothetical protein
LAAGFRGILTSVATSSLCAQITALFVASSFAGTRFGTENEN